MLRVKGREGEYFKRYIVRAHCSSDQCITKVGYRGYRSAEMVVKYNAQSDDRECPDCGHALWWGRPNSLNKSGINNINDE